MNRMKILPLLACTAIFAPSEEPLSTPSETWTYTPVTAPEEFEAKFAFDAEVANWSKILKPVTDAIEHYATLALAAQQAATAAEDETQATAAESTEDETLKNAFKAIDTQIDMLAHPLRGCFETRMAPTLQFAIQELPVLQAPELLHVRNFLALHTPFSFCSGRCAYINCQSDNTNRTTHRFLDWCVSIFGPKLAAETGFDEALLMSEFVKPPRPVRRSVCCTPENPQSPELTRAMEQLQQLKTSMEPFLKNLVELAPEQDELTAPSFATAVPTARPAPPAFPVTAAQAANSSFPDLAAASALPCPLAISNPATPTSSGAPTTGFADASRPQAAVGFSSRPCIPADNTLARFIKESIANRSAPWDAVSPDERKAVDWLYEHVSSGDKDAVDYLINFASAMQAHIANAKKVTAIRNKCDEYRTQAEAAKEFVDPALVGGDVMDILYNLVIPAL